MAALAAIWPMIQAGLSAIGSFLGIVKTRQDENNAPAIVANKLAQQDAQDKHQFEVDLESEDLEKIRKDAAQ